MDLVGAAGPPDAATSACSSPVETGASLGVIEIEPAGGRRLRITGAYDPDALARLLRGLSA